MKNISFYILWLLRLFTIYLIIIGVDSIVRIASAGASAWNIIGYIYVLAFMVIPVIIAYLIVFFLKGRAKIKQRLKLDKLLVCGMILIMVSLGVQLYLLSP